MKRRVTLLEYSKNSGEWGTGGISDRTTARFQIEGEETTTDYLHTSQSAPGWSQYKSEVLHNAQSYESAGGDDTPNHHPSFHRFLPLLNQLKVQPWPIGESREIEFPKPLPIQFWDLIEKLRQNPEKGQKGVENIIGEYQFTGNELEAVQNTLETAEELLRDTLSNEHSKNADQICSHAISQGKYFYLALTTELREGNEDLLRNIPPAPAFNIPAAINTAVINRYANEDIQMERAQTRAEFSQDPLDPELLLAHRIEWDPTPSGQARYTHTPTGNHILRQPNLLQGDKEERQWTDDKIEFFEKHMSLDNAEGWELLKALKWTESFDREELTRSLRYIGPERAAELQKFVQAHVDILREYHFPNRKELDHKGENALVHIVTMGESAYHDALESREVLDAHLNGEYNTPAGYSDNFSPTLGDAAIGKFNNIIFLTGKLAEEITSIKFLEAALATFHHATRVTTDGDENKVTIRLDFDRYTETKHALAYYNQQGWEKKTGRGGYCEFQSATLEIGLPGKTRERNSIDDYNDAIRKEGAEAFKAGLEREDCDYSPDSPEREIWMGGYSQESKKSLDGPKTADEEFAPNGHTYTTQDFSDACTSLGKLAKEYGYQGNLPFQAASVYAKVEKHSVLTAHEDQNLNGSQTATILAAKALKHMQPRDRANWVEELKRSENPELTKDKAEKQRELGTKLLAELHPDRPEEIRNERLLGQIERALRTGKPTDIGQTQLRYLKKNQEFEVNGNYFEALESGVFQRFEVRKGSDGPVQEHRWLHIGKLDDLPALLKSTLKEMSPKDKDMLSVSLAAQVVLGEEAKERQARRQKTRQTAEVTLEPN